MGSKKLERYRVLRMTEEELRRLEEDYVKRIDGARMDALIEFVDFTHEDFMEAVLDLMSQLFVELGLFRLGGVFGNSAEYMRDRLRDWSEEGEEIEESEGGEVGSGGSPESFGEVTK